MSKVKMPRCALSHAWCWDFEGVINARNLLEIQLGNWSIGDSHLAECNQNDWRGVDGGLGMESRGIELWLADSKKKNVLYVPAAEVCDREVWWIEPSKYECIREKRK